MNNILQNIIKKDEIVIADGAMGTMLIKYGLEVGKCPEEINLSTPGVVEKIHKEYIESGAKIIQTNTFGANRIKLKKYGLEKQLQSIIEESVKIAKEVAAGEAWVGLSVGPTGELMKPFGTLSFHDLYEVFYEQIAAGVNAGADIICVETMGDIGELKAAYLAARNFKIPVSCSVSIETAGRTLMGTDLATFARSASKWGCDLIGTNCAGPQQILENIDRLIKNSNAPCYVRPNAGQPILEDGKTFYSMKSEEFASFGVDFARIGLAVFGGCCGTNPEYIHSLKEKTKNIRREKLNTEEKGIWLTSSMASVEVTDNLKYFSLDIKKYPNAIEISNILRDGSVQKFDVVLLKLLDVPAKGTEELIENIQVTTRKPLIFEVNDLGVLEKCIRVYKGIPGIILNGISREDAKNLIEKYGAQFV